MNPTRDTADSPAGQGGEFDPRQAAALLDQTTRQTRRRIEPFPPWLLVIRAFIALAIYGALWLSVRGQHPYQHPTAAVIPVAVGLALVNLVATLTFIRRATAGVSTRSRRLKPAEYALWSTVWLAVFAVMGFLIGAGMSDRIVYGIYPAAAPLIVAGVAGMLITAPRADWHPFWASAAITVTGVLAVFAGPAGAWAVAGAGACAVLLARAAFVARRQHRGVVRS